MSNESLYGSPALYEVPFSIRETQTRQELYDLYGLTDTVEDDHSYQNVYLITSNSTGWLDDITNGAKIIYDSTTNKYFISNLFTNNSESTRWFTFAELMSAYDKSSGTTKRISLSNTDANVYSTTLGTKVPAIIFTDPSDGVDYYYIREDALPSGAQAIWRTKAQIESLNFSTEEIYKPLCFTNINSGTSKVTLKKIGTSIDLNPEYYTSRDGITWSSVHTPDSNGIIIDETLSSYGDTLYIKGSRNNDQFLYDYLTFEMTGELEASGNVNSLLSSTNFGSILSLNSRDRFNAYASFTFYSLFSGCSSLHSSPLLPATTILESDAYRDMFGGCDHLESLPELPATTLSSACYYGMFYDCDGISEIPSNLLPATTLHSYCYANMFTGCTGIHSIPSGLLNATSIVDSCYYGMFRLCTNLTTVPLDLLPATTLAESCYQEMFSGCRNLTVLPTLRFTAAHISCQYMFGDCTSITSIPDGYLYNCVPAETSFFEMFSGCTGLTTVPYNMLHPSVVANYCYGWMFRGCYNLTNTPKLSATSLVSQCYEKMFYDCTSLNKVYCSATSMANQNATTDWLYNVANSGEFHCDSVEIWEQGSASGIPSGWTIYFEKPLCLKNTGTYPVSIVLQNTREATSPSDPTQVAALTDISYQYSTNSDYTNTSSWSTYNFSGDTGSTITLQPNGLVYFKGSRGTQTEKSYMQFVMSIDDVTQIDNAQISASGNTNSMLNATTYITLTNINSSSYNYTFNSLFKDCSLLTTCPELFATNIYSYCYINMFRNSGVTSSCALKAASCSYCGYRNMFYDCKNLTSTKAISCTSISSYSFYGMFQNCENLVTPPELHGTSAGYYSYAYMFSGCKKLSSLPSIPSVMNNSACYQNMFDGCERITEIPANYLSCTDIRNVCYRSMFRGCKGLTSISYNLLPATTLAQGCYTEMFYGCTGLTSLPSNLLPATVLKTSCYDSMFYGCTGLTSVPSNLLPATTLADNCYAHMFHGCSNLANTPDLPAINLYEGCYSQMFYNCEHLTSVSSTLLPATNINAQKCYYSMFCGCTRLVNIPQLPATTLSKNCYAHMFNGCNSLTTVPSNLLHATTLSDSCYAYMFNGCVSLSTSPVLPAEELVSSCYYAMFNGCNSLNSITCYATSKASGATNCTYLWVNNVSYSGTFTCVDETFWSRGTSGIPTNWTVKRDESRSPLYFVNTNTSSSTVTLSVNGTLTTSYETSLDGVSWSPYTMGTSVPLNNTNDKVYFRGSRSAQTANSAGNFLKFSMTGKLEAHGNVLSLLDASSFTSITNLSNYTATFYRLFGGCTSLAKAPDLYAETLVDDCYSYMFYGCTGLTSVAEDNASTLDDRCYYHMYDGCSSLTATNTLKATTVPARAYSYMFNDCVALVNAPEILATTLTGTNNLQGMFYGCSLLETPPSELKPLTLTSYCYASMFWFCVKLESMPEILATTSATYCFEYMFNRCYELMSVTDIRVSTLANYSCQYMFQYCSSITNTPDIYATSYGQRSCNYMFYSCTGLIEANLYADSYGQEACQYMFLDCTSLETAYMTVMSIGTRSCQYMFKGCTALLYAEFDDLDSIGMDGCYRMFEGCRSLSSTSDINVSSIDYRSCQEMFYNCERLLGIRINSNVVNVDCFSGMCNGCTYMEYAYLAPTALTTRCYQNMFKECTHLDEVTCYALTGTDSTTLSGWMTNVSSSGSFYAEPSASYSTGASGIPSGWTRYPV